MVPEKDEILQDSLNEPELLGKLLEEAFKAEKVPHAKEIKQAIFCHNSKLLLALKKDFEQLKEDISAKEQSQEQKFSTKLQELKSKAVTDFEELKTTIGEVQEKFSASKAEQV